MLRFVDPNSMKIGTNNEKTFALHEAAKRGHVKIMMVMQRSLDFPLYAVQVLIAAGADVDLQYQLSNGDLWDTALHIAAWNGHLSAGKVNPKSINSMYTQCVLNMHSTLLHPANSVAFIEEDFSGNYNGLK